MLAGYSSQRDSALMLATQMMPSWVQLKMPTCLCKDDTCPIWSRSLVAEAVADSDPVRAANGVFAGMAGQVVALTGRSI